MFSAEAEISYFDVSASFQLRICKKAKTRFISYNPKEFLFHTILTY